MSNTRIDVLLPTGRVVQGSLTKAQDKDGDGKPLVVKSGPNQGKPTVKFFFSVAIPKVPGQTHWASTEWGAKIWALGHSAWPAGQAQAPTFAWKVEDGDSAIPNKKGKKNCDREGFPGCWVVNLSSGFAPNVYNANGSQRIEAEAVKLGFYVQVMATVDSNRSDMNPGMYINHSMVAFQGFGPEIHVGPDAAAVGFGSGPAPVGMSAAPIGGLTPAPAGAPLPPAPAAPAPAAYVAPAPAAAPAAPAPVAVVPAPAMIVPPAAPAAPAAPTGPTVKLPGVTWEALVQAGWNETTARAAGHIV